MLDNLKIKRRLIGKKIDLNWLKYKMIKDSKYLRRLNKSIEELVSVDISIETYEENLKQEVDNKHWKKQGKKVIPNPKYEQVEK